MKKNIFKFLSFGIFLLFLSSCKDEYVYHEGEFKESPTYIYTYINEKGDTIQSRISEYHTANGKFNQVNDSIWIPVHRILSIKEIK